VGSGELAGVQRITVREKKRSPPINTRTPTNFQYPISDLQSPTLRPGPSTGSGQGLELAAVGKTLRRYRGVQRRFEVKGEANGIVVIDDYAHHPTQIRTTLRAARENYPGRTLWAAFQPHTYSRTKALLSEFAESFADADHVVVTDIYPAREFDDLGVSAADIVACMSHLDARYIPGLSEAADHLFDHLKPGDVLITLGAGDGYKVGENVLAKLEGKR